MIKTAGGGAASVFGNYSLLFTLISSGSSFWPLSNLILIRLSSSTPSAGTLGESFRNKLGEVKNTNSFFKSFEERVGSTVNTVKVENIENQRESLSSAPGTA